jgi:hypothetical protein
MIASIGYVLTYHEGPSWELVATGTGLLFALPGIRASQPGLPPTPTISDSESYFTWTISLLAEAPDYLVVGYYWSIVLLGLR